LYEGSKKEIKLIWSKVDGKTQSFSVESIGVIT